MSANINVRYNTWKNKKKTKFFPLWKSTGDLSYQHDVEVVVDSPKTEIVVGKRVAWRKRGVSYSEALSHIENCADNVEESSPHVNQEQLTEKCNCKKVPKKARETSEKNCKLCEDNKVEIVFVPCGHAMSCQNCANKCLCCPVCRGRIEWRQKLFI